MNSLAEQATINFYQWEARGRGYLLQNHPIDLLPPYAPYQRPIASSVGYIDDGKVPSIFKRLKEFFGDSQPQDQDASPVHEIVTHPVSYNHKRIAYSVTFPKRNEVNTATFQHLLELLSYSQRPLSFEILAQRGTICIQFTADQSDALRLHAQLKAFLPSAIVRIVEIHDINFDFDAPVAISDFGLDNEFMLPLRTADTVTLDPLTAVFGTLETLKESETAIIQILFQGLTAPWAQEVKAASSDGQGGSFFSTFSEFPKYASEKVAHPLFGAIFRIGAQCETQEASNYLAQELTRSITTVSASSHNRLIPLSNEGYSYNDHLGNLYYRTTNRLGCIVNLKELTLFVHYPGQDIVSEKIGLANVKTKRQKRAAKEGVCIGTNTHAGVNHPVYLDTETRLSHTHIIGATGVGKSTLLATMMLADIEAGRGCALFDPHGDICDDIMASIPKHRIKDVIIIDPSDSEYPIGLNLLEAHSEAEKIVLTSDLVTAFKRHATAWGDNMTAVLHNAVATFLASSQGGTLIDLKRFLIEKSFRDTFLHTVEDPSLVYYWHQEYPMLRKGIAPLLTRIDTFLRSSLIRYMLVQKTGMDFTMCLDSQKIVLIKLAQGLIGESNSYLLGSLLLAKFNQAAMARQQQAKAQRTPFMLYCDEFQNVITPSLESMLSGARKYALGLTLIHQELAQIDNPKVLNSLLSNPSIRICFRLGDQDAKRLESGFSYFDRDDLQGLERGQAIVRIGSQTNDFNIETSPLLPTTKDYSHQIIALTRERYATPRTDLEALIADLYSGIEVAHPKPADQTTLTPLPPPKTEPYIQDTQKENTISPNTSFEAQKQAILDTEEQNQQESEHRAIQNYVLSLGQARNFKSEVEVPTQNGGRIDVLLSKEKLTIAVEVSVTNTVDYEVQNLQKCLGEQVSHVYIISERPDHLKHIAQRAKSTISPKDFRRVSFGTPVQFQSFLDSVNSKPKKTVKQVRGYRVRSNTVSSDNTQSHLRSNRIQQIILNSLNSSKK